MKIRLRNIGIIKDSTIELNGLTVITGRNCSGKTTVGKALYSVIDATSDLEIKADVDKVSYIDKCLREVYSTINIFRFINEDNNVFFSKYPEIFKLISNYQRYSSTNMICNEEYARALLAELKGFDVNDFVESGIITKKFAIDIARTNDIDKAVETIDNKVYKAIASLEIMFVKLESDFDLSVYSRECINQTLYNEFHTQIHPSVSPSIISLIDVYDDDSSYYKIKIKDNKIINTDDHVYISSPFKNVFFIDDPYILDKRLMPMFYITPAVVNESWLNTSRIILHDEMLERVLRSNKTTSVFEDTIIDKETKEIKELINSIIPGAFQISNNGEFKYIPPNNKELHFANLATGMKSFSFIKILLEKGFINKKNLLILDEPETHLHPEWQNILAEIIVLLVAKLGTHILLTTHSSQFMLAIDAFMRKYEINDNRCNFYQTRHIDGDMVEYECVNDDLGKIYGDYVEYLSDMKVLRDSFLYGEDSEG